MVTFGIEGISVYDLARKNGRTGLEDVWFLRTICYDLDKGLKEHKHTEKFYKVETDCAETDIRDVTFKGVDNYFADNVDLFFIGTHGHNDKGIISLAYNNKVGEWSGSSSLWKLGDKKLRWLLLWSCSTMDLSYISALLHIFQNLHVICGAYGAVNLSHTTDESGEKLADNLTEHDKTVADAWIDGLSDWFENNHQMVVAAESRDSIDITFRTDWSLTTMARDHLTRPVPDIPNSDIYWLSVKWVEGNDIKQRRTQIK